MVKLPIFLGVFLYHLKKGGRESIFPRIIEMIRFFILGTELAASIVADEGFWVFSVAFP
jgi:hypothetical protein